MSIVRYVPALAMATLVTFGLVFLMQFLIQQDLKGPGEVPTYNVPDIIMPEVEIRTEYDTSMPEKPEEFEEPPPDVPDIEMEAPELENTGINIKPKFDKQIKVAGPGLGSDGEFLPIVKVQAQYPQRAAQRGIQGHCTVQYTVTTLGTTKDHVIVDCPEKVFSRASIKAAKKFKYKPRVVEGEAVEVPNVQNRFIFQLADDK